jgi:hypothetical protein
LKRSKVLNGSTLESLVNASEYEHIIIGTGKLARDMQKKLLLLGLKAPYLVGMATDRENGILGYSDLAELGNPKRFKFILCCESGELALHQVARVAIFKFLGRADHGHPQVVSLSHVNLLNPFGKEMADSIAANSFVADGYPYLMLGAPEESDSFKIHVFGTCLNNNIMRHSKQALWEIVHEKLDEAGFSHTIYDWGQSSQATADCVSRFIRDIGFYKIDLLVLYLGSRDIDPLSFATINALPVKAGVAVYLLPFIARMESLGIKASNGIHHNADLVSIRVMHQKMLGALARRHGFAFWDVMAAISDTIGIEKSMALKGLTPGFFQRKIAAKEKLLTALDSRYTKDYSDTFSQEGDVFSLFADGMHYSDEGCRLVAERFAADILNEFGDKQERNT